MARNSKFKLSGRKSKKMFKRYNNRTHQYNKGMVPKYRGGIRL